MPEIKLTEQEANTTRKWFDCLHDVTKLYFEEDDWKLAKKIYNACGMDFSKARKSNSSKS